MGLGDASINSDGIGVDGGIAELSDPGGSSKWFFFPDIPRFDRTLLTRLDLPE